MTRADIIWCVVMLFGGIVMMFLPGPLAWFDRFGPVLVWAGTFGLVAWLLRLQRRLIEKANAERQAYERRDGRPFEDHNPYEKEDH